MIKRAYICFLLSISLIGVLCSCSQETDYESRISDLEQRVTRLEQLCSEMNANISALQTLVGSMQQGDYITAVNPIEKDGKVTGYSITFAKGTPITIYNGQDGIDGQDGKDGTDGHNPVIGVRQDTDGVWYWTLNGEWLLDDNGQKIKAEGRDGKDGENGNDGQNGTDGVTPKLKIEEGYWLVSYDNGQNWTILGKAIIGNDNPQGDGVFLDVDYLTDPDYVIFYLSDGSELKIPTWHAYEKLQTLVGQLNSSLEGLQTIVAALQDADYVTSVEPVYEDGEVIGYRINFNKSGSVTVYNGKDGADGQDGQNGTDGHDGADGHTPSISIRQDTDGIWYWTLDGEWLLDDKGKKVKAVGSDGQNGTDGHDGQNGTDGVTPLLKIEDGYWFVSYDNGKTWTKLDKATGADGRDGDSFFNGVTVQDDYVVFELSDGQTFTLCYATSLQITVDREKIIAAPHCTGKLSFSVTPVNAEVEVMTSADIKARVDGQYISYSTGDIIDEYSKLTVFVTDGKNTVMRTVPVEQEWFIFEGGDSRTMTKEGGQLQVSYTTNVLSVAVAKDAGWLAVTRSGNVLTINAEANPDLLRTGQIYLSNEDNLNGDRPKAALTISQAGTPYSAPSFQMADPVGTSYSWYNLLPQKKKEFIYPHILTSYIAWERYRWDNMEYIIAGEVPKDIECENIGENDASDHAANGYLHIQDMTPNAVIKACGGGWDYLKQYLDAHPDKLLMVSCACDYLGGDTVEQLRADPNYQALKDILLHDNVVVSVASSNTGQYMWLVLNEKCTFEEGGGYNSASVNSGKNNKITVVGYSPMWDIVFGKNCSSCRPLGFGAGNLVFPFMPLVSGDYVWDDTTSSYPTAALSGTLGNFLSIIMKNRPGTTLEGAMTVMKSMYLIQDTFKYKNDQGEIVDGEHWYFFDTDKFIREEILHKAAVESALSGSGTVILPSVGGLCYEGPGVQFTIGQTSYDSVESNRSVLEAAVVAGTPVEWSYDPARAQLYGISGPVTIIVRVMDTHAHVVPDVSLTVLH